MIARVNGGIFGRRAPPPIAPVGGITARPPSIRVFVIDHSLRRRSRVRNAQELRQPRLPGSKTSGVARCGHESLTARASHRPVVEILLLEIRQQIDERRNVREVDIPCRKEIAHGRHRPFCRLVVCQREADLPQVVLARGSPGRFSGRLHRRQEQAHECADDGDHDQELDEREAMPSRRRTSDEAARSNGEPARHRNRCPATRLFRNHHPPPPVGLMPAPGKTAGQTTTCQKPTRYSH